MDSVILAHPFSGFKAPQNYLWEINGASQERAFVERIDSLQRDRGGD
jgi:hypothetical protein